MIFSKTFNSELYSQIVCMLDKEVGYYNGVENLVITFYFYADDSLHTFNLSFGDTELGLKLRQECFDGLNAKDVQQIIYDKLAEGKQ